MAHRAINAVLFLGGCYFDTPSYSAPRHQRFACRFPNLLVPPPPLGRPPLGPPLGDAPLTLGGKVRLGAMEKATNIRTVGDEQEQRHCHSKDQQG